MLQNRLLWKPTWSNQLFLFLIQMGTILLNQKNYPTNVQTFTIKQFSYLSFQTHIFHKKLTFHLNKKISFFVIQVSIIRNMYIWYLRVYT